jgi:hypothetical protein
LDGKELKDSIPAWSFLRGKDTIFYINLLFHQTITQ